MQSFQPPLLVGNDLYVLQPGGCAVSRLDRRSESASLVLSDGSLGIQHEPVMFEIKFESVFRFDAQQRPHAQRRIQIPHRKRQQQSLVLQTQ